MISTAIYEILNSSLVSGAVNGIYPNVATQGVDFPVVVYNQRGEPENSKDGRRIKHYEVQIDVYADKTKTGNDGINQSQEIAELVKDALDDFSGTVGGFDIQTVVLKDETSFYDPISQAGRTMIEFSFRVNT